MAIVHGEEQGEDGEEKAGLGASGRELENRAVEKGRWWSGEMIGRHLRAGEIFSTGSDEKKGLGGAGSRVSREYRGGERRGKQRGAEAASNEPLQGDRKQTCCK